LIFGFDFMFRFYSMVLFLLFDGLPEALSCFGLAVTALDEDGSVKMDRR
jgi:hypothetical protein